jgi:hypothetical protein
LLFIFQMTLLLDRFYVGDVSGFLGLLKVLKTDPEFRLRFDFGQHCLELESMMMAGVVGVGVRLHQGEGGIFVPSPTVREDHVIFRVDSQSFLKAMTALNPLTYAYLSLRPDEDSAICIDIYDGVGQCMGSAVVNTLTLDDSDREFLVTNHHEPLSYAIKLKSTGRAWGTYLQAATTDTVIRYDSQMHVVHWETSNVHTRVSLHLGVSPQESPDVSVCLCPGVVSVLRTILQVVQKHPTTFSMHEDLPVCVTAVLDRQGSFLRVYAGTKDDE